MFPPEHTFSIARLSQISLGLSTTDHVTEEFSVSQIITSNIFSYQESYYLTMSRQQLEVRKMLAVRNIMSTFGDDAFGLIRVHIMTEYGVSMDKECPLDILRTVLVELFGESAAELIMECIFVETDRLCEQSRA